jgi:hypothetical protein
MQKVGMRVLIFAGAFMAYAKLNNEDNLFTVSLVIGALGVGLMIFGPKK